MTELFNENKASNDLFVFVSSFKAIDVHSHGLRFLFVHITIIVQFSDNQSYFWNFHT